MLDKINDTGLIIIGSVFAIAGLWELVLPVNEILIKDAWTLLVTIAASLGLFGLGIGSGLKAERKNQAKKEAAKKEEARHG